jgi:hypothetical protein
MIKLNLDICTTRRISGWLFDEVNLAASNDIYIESGSRRAKVELNPRLDVAQAFSLTDSNVGIEVNIPDVFDGLVDNYKLYYRNTEIFSYRSQYEKIVRASEQISRTAETELDASPTNYAVGRHVIFIYENMEHQKNLEILSEPMIRRSFPNKIGGCEFTIRDINILNPIKKDIIDNLNNILFVIPSELFPNLYRISPTIAASQRLVTIYNNSSFESATGIHTHQLNNFIINKTRRTEDLPPFISCVVRVWELIENYANIVFNQNPQLFFMIFKSGEPDITLNRYISDNVQLKRKEDIVRVRHNENELVLLNISAYSKLFDRIGEKDCWKTAIKRGLRHLDMVL